MHRLSPLAAWRLLKHESTHMLDRLFARVYCGSFGILAYMLTAPIAELHFYFLVKRFVSDREGQHGTHSLCSDCAEAIRMWEQQLMSPPEALDAFVRGWFLGEGSPRKKDVTALLAWSLYNQNCAECTQLQHHEIDGLIHRIEACLGRSFAPGSDAGLRLMGYTKQQSGSVHKPLVAYLALDLSRRLLASFLRYHGFELQAAGRLAFWVRRAPDTLRRPQPPVPPPVVLLHGVLGLLPYPFLLHLLAKRHTGAVLVPLFPHAAITLAHLCGALGEQQRPHDAFELVAAVRTMVARYSPSGSPPRASFIAHSLGSCFLAPLIKAAPELVAAAAFIDPICFMLPDACVLRNYLYASPPLPSPTTRGDLVARDTFHFLQTHLIANEPSQQDYFRTCWWWAQHWLEPSELSCPAIVHLSSHDTIVDAPRVHAHLTQWAQRSTPHNNGGDRGGARDAQLEVHLHESWCHGWLLLHPAAQVQLIHRLQLLALDSNRQTRTIDTTTAWSGLTDRSDVALYDDDKSPVSVLTVGPRRFGSGGLTAKRALLPAVDTTPGTSAMMIKRDRERGAPLGVAREGARDHECSMPSPNRHVRFCLRGDVHMRRGSDEDADDVETTSAVSDSSDLSTEAIADDTDLLAFSEPFPPRRAPLARKASRVDYSALPATPVVSPAVPRRALPSRRTSGVCVAVDDDEQSLTPSPVVSPEVPRRVLGGVY